MELGAFAAALVRRWYMVVVVAALAAGACVFTVSSVGATYTTQASVLLFPPTSDGVEEEEQPSTNPYLELGGLTTARDILIRSLTSQAERDTIAEAHPDVDYALVPDGTSAGPIVLVEVAAPSAREALAAQATLLSEFPGALDDLQVGLGLSRAEFITARELTVDARAETVHKSQVRAGIVAVAGVLLVGLALIGFVDGWLATRAGSRAGRQRTAGPTGVDPAHKAGPGSDEQESDEQESDEQGSDAPTAGLSPRLSTKQARKQARRSARDLAVRVAREEAREDAREMDRASA